jgi:isopenicillin N synthase-like dioxygenase
MQGSGPPDAVRGRGGILNHVFVGPVVAISPVPLIDVSGLRSPNRPDRLRVAEQIRRAALDKGFFYIEKHGVPERLIEAVFEESHGFFAAPLADRLTVGRTHSPCGRGFEPIGGQDLEQTGAPDLKEAFDLGVELPPDDPHVLAGTENCGPNQWPHGLPAFRPVMESYFQAMLTLAVQLMRALALSLDLDEDYFEAFCSEPVALLRLLHYPQQPVRSRAGEKGCGAHTDWGAITLLLQDDAGGLQIRDPVSGWLHAPPRAGAFVVNLGDLMARWTNDRYRSTEHRVINLSGRDRYSVPFFLDGNPDHLVTCLPGCSGPAYPARYPPVTVAGHTEQMRRLTKVETPVERFAHG